MIFISAQPDEYYFYWQLELQIYNFRTLKISLNKIHVLIGYDEQRGLSRDFTNFRRKYSKVKIFTYSDTRKSRKYLSSLRPHILAKHFEQNPQLSKEVFFYHDSDIIFSRLPNFDTLIEGNTWYASNTRSYLSTNYILATAGEQLFLQMCEVVGIDPEQVKENDVHAGGAQYIIKGVNAAFWHKLERDCEKIYSLLAEAERTLNSDGFDEKPFIQKWCSDMWAIWWNALIHEHKFEVHDELDFCWAHSPISEWHRTSILHYTGGVNKHTGRLFRKEDYVLHSPFYEEHDMISLDTCSYPVSQLIRRFNDNNLRRRKNLEDVSFLIPIKVDSIDRLKNIKASTSFLNNNFKTNIIVMEVDKIQRINPSDLPDGIHYSFKRTDNPRLFRTQINNEMIKMCTTRFFALYDADVIVPVRQINEAVKMLRKGDCNIVSPYDGSFLNVDRLLKEIFIKVQDDFFLSANKYKAHISSKRSFGGCVFLNRARYIAAGMENENLTSWGPDDIERVKRMQIFGFKTARVKGCLFHLEHDRKIDSGYNGRIEYEELMLKYLAISDMNSSELLNHIETWTWRKI